MAYFPGYLKELYGEKRLKRLLQSQQFNVIGDKCYLKLCLLWPKIAIDKVLGPVQLLTDRKLGESFADLMTKTGGVIINTST